MADEDNLSMDDGELGGSAPEKKSKGLGALLPTLLKWIGIAVGAVLLIVTDRKSVV